MKHRVYSALRYMIVIGLVAAMLCSCLPVFAADNGGTTYYVSANGTGDGLSEDAPMPLLTINGTLLKGGDTVLFRRGDIFYGTFEPIVTNANNTNRVDVGAYGNGEMPIFSNAKILKSSWKKETNGFYSFDLATDGNYGGVHNNDANVGFMEDKNGKKHGVRRQNAATCVNQYDFYCEGTVVYAKSTEDPYTVLGELRLATHDNALIRAASNMNIHDLHLQDTGYGIVWGESGDKNLHVYNCVIANVGGIVLGSQKEFVKAGNGIELYNKGTNVLIERNIFRDTYDVAFTCQGDTPGEWRNITVKENIFINNTQAIEFWCRSDKGISNLSFTDNICINQGGGWGTLARPNPESATDVLAYLYYAPAWNMTIQNNTFFHTDLYGSAYYMPSASLLSMRAKSKIDNNRYYFPQADGGFARWSQGIGYSFTFEQWKGTLTALDEKGTVTHDANSTMTAVGSGTEQHKAMVNIAATSLNFYEIFQAVKAADVYVPFTMEEPITPNAPGNDGSSLLLWLAIGGGVVLAVVVVVVVLMVAGKKKKAVAQEEK